jgi:hypothetical protein
MLLEEAELWSFVEGKVTLPTDPVQSIKHNKTMAKAKRVVSDSVKDRLIPHIAKMKLSKGFV